jgi:hypothetical protein
VQNGDFGPNWVLKVDYMICEVSEKNVVERLHGFLVYAKYAKYLGEGRRGSVFSAPRFQDEETWYVEGRQTLMTKRSTSGFGMCLPPWAPLKDISRASCL